MYLRRLDRVRLVGWCFADETEAGWSFVDSIKGGLSFTDGTEEGLWCWSYLVNGMLGGYPTYS